MTATVTCHCPLCGKVSFVTCDEDAYDRYVTTSTPIQEIFQLCNKIVIPAAE